MKITTRITPNLWFKDKAEEAAKYYCGIFKNSKISRISYYTGEGQEIHGMAEGTVMTVEFTLDGQEFVGLNGGPHFKFNEAISFIVNCETQDEVDHYWNKLSAGGDPKAQMCGWLKDKYGLSWQVVPVILSEMMLDKNKEKANRAMNAMLKMKKMDIPALEKAFEGR
jgi:predicted 3-demethylubiquinone-9 3-methyltransferase (glyoxalase superfamily)